jgi:hypothetical protein
MGVVARQFDGVMCVLCGKRPSSPTGEHVWPDWFFEMFPPADIDEEAHYETWIGRQPVLNR